MSRCIERHPILSAVITLENTNKPRFEKATHLDLANHVQRLPDVLTGEHDAVVASTVEQMHDAPLPHRERIPPWKVIVQRVPPARDAATRRVSDDAQDKQHYLILLAYYHSHGDGMAGLAFTRTLYHALNEPSATSPPSNTVPPSQSPFLPPIEKAAHLSISASYLLTPLLATLLPSSLNHLLGIKPHIGPDAPHAWRGAERTSATDLRTRVELLRVPAGHVAALRTACRAHGCKATGLLHQLVVRALSERLSDTPEFIAQSAVDMRRVASGVGRDDMALCVSGVWEILGRTDGADWSAWMQRPEGRRADAVEDGVGDAEGEDVWSRARRTTKVLAECARQTHNQPIGLLPWVPDMRGWTREQIGRPRDVSYELSNLLSFEPDERSEATSRTDDDGAQKPWTLRHVVFSQPANCTGGALDVNIASRAQGDMSVALSWQVGALGVEEGEEGERMFVRGLGERFAVWMEELADASWMRDGMVGA